jgi:hypothetical protein
MATNVYKTGEEKVIDNYSKYSEEFIEVADDRKKFKTIFRFGVRGPATIRKQNKAYKVTVGKTTPT